ncbi:MAG: FGGY family carbohydrate kinase, partial [Planctomycetota bacterium]
MSWLGVDIGTSSCKAAAFDDAGRCLAEAKQDYELLRPEPDAAVIDPDRLSAAWRHAIADCAAQVAHDPPRALAISSQGEAVLALDASGRPLAPVLTSLDNRPLPALAALESRMGSAAIYQRTGHRPQAMYSLAKLAWLRQTQP